MEQPPNTSHRKIAQNILCALAEEKHPLRDHQQEAVRRGAEHILAENGQEIRLPDGQSHDSHTFHLPTKVDDHFLAVSATGTGKTRILGALMDGSGARTLLLTPRKLLGRQAMEEFCEEMDIPANKVGIYDSEASQTERAAALKKPYLISTFQSLPSLVGTDPVSGRYRLKREIGARPLILLDEAHTAQGQLTSDILNNLKEVSLLAGVTATEAGVSTTLFGNQSPVFNLDLVTAIEQHKLANGVRTGLIDVAIDEDWAESMCNTSTSREFTRTDVERFAQTPAVIKAMVDFHLSYKDEQLGKIDRFPTLVFTQGVDAAKQAVTAFNSIAKAKGSTARAAYVSGDMKQDERKPILDGFRNGSIKVLFNDRMLEMGYDLPEATVTYSLKPTNYRHTAEQQLGRVTRKQPQGYAEKYGMDKIALAINVRPKGAHPYLFAEILGGVPARYAPGVETGNEPGKGKPPTPEENPFLGEDVEIHMGYDDLHKIIAGEPRRDAALEVPKGFITQVELARSLRIDTQNPRFKKSWNALTDVATKTRKPGESQVTLLLDDNPTKPITLGWYKNGPHTSWYVAEASIPVFAMYLGVSTEEVKQLPTGFLGQTELARSLRFATHNPRFRESWNALTDVATKTRKPGESQVILLLDDDLAKPVTLGWYKNGSHTRWYIAEASIPVFAAHLGVSTEEVEQLPPGYLGQEKLARNLHLNSTNPRFRESWNALTDVATKMRKPGESQVTLLLDDDHAKPVTLGWYKNSGNTGWYIAEASIPVFAAHLGVSTEKVKQLPPGFLGQTELARSLRIAPHSPHFRESWNALTDVATKMHKPGESQVTLLLEENPAKPVTLGWYKNGKNTGWYIAEASIPVFAAHLGVSTEKVKQLPPGFLRQTELARSLHTTLENPRFKKSWDALTDTATKTRKPGESQVALLLDDNPAKPVTLGWYKNRGTTSWYIAEASIPVFAAHLEEKKTEEKPQTHAGRVEHTRKAIDPDTIAGQKKVRGSWAKGLEEK